MWSVFGAVDTGHLGPVVPLVRAGLNFTADGRVWKYKAFTSFRGPELFAKGERGWLEDYFGRWAEMGANTARSFCIWDNTDYSPKTMPGYYDKLESYLEFRKRWGYEHLVFFCNQRDGGPHCLTAAEQDDHVRRLVEMARRVGNVLGEIANEDGHPDNGSVSARFAREIFAGVLMARSTWYTASDEDPQRPGAWLDWVTVHPGRDLEWAWEGGKILLEAQKGGLGAFPAAGLPAVIGEPIRIAEGTTPRQHADHAFHALNFGAGSCVHGGFNSLPQARHTESDLQNCKFPPPGTPLDCIKAVRDVWTSPLVNPDVAALGAYVRGQEDGRGECPIVHRDRYVGDDEDPTGVGRSYFMRVGNRMYGGPVDPGQDYRQVEARDGWRIVGQGGYAADGRGGNVLVLER